MKITVFGASSPIGFEIVKQALYKELPVLAFDRNTINTSFPDDKKLVTISASLFDEEQLERAVDGADAVIFALSPGSSEANNSRSLGIKKLVDVMTASSLKRLVVISDASVVANANGNGILLYETSYLERGIVLGDEYLLAKSILASSDLDWTMLAVDTLIEAAPSGSFKELLEANVEALGSASTGNLAMAALNAAMKGEYVKQVVLIKDN